MFLFHSGGLLIGQSIKSNHETQTLQEAILVIESGSDYIFNYDPSLLSAYSYTGKLDLSAIDNALEELFYDSPFLYEVNGKTVLVYYPNPLSYRICGTLVDAISEEPLVGANITVLDSAIGTQSDTSGYFEFQYTGHKNQQIEITYLGYKVLRFPLQESKDCIRRKMEVNQDIFGQEIIISDYLLDGISLGKEFTAFNFDFDQLSKNLSNVEHDIFKTAQLLPGINSIDDSATNLQIRGSNSGQNLVLWEGVPLYNAGHVFGMISAINPFSVEEVSIYKGAHDPKYDNRVGGILDISLTDELASAFHGSVGTTLTELHSNLSIPIVKDQVTLEIAGRQSINGIFNSPTLQSYTDKVFQFSIIDDQSSSSVGDPLRTEQTLAFQDWNAKILYRPSSKFMVNGGFYRNAQDFSYSFWFDGDSYVSEDKIDLKTQILSLETELEVTKYWSTRLSFYQSSYANNYDKTESKNAAIINSNKQINLIQEQSTTFSNALNLGPRSLLNLGYEYNHKELTLDLGDELNFDDSFLPFEVEEANFHNLFQSFNYKRKSLQIDAGNRSSYYQERGRWFHSPRINIRYTLSDHLKVKADAGIYHQFISQLTNVGANQIKVDNPLWILNSRGESLSQKASKIAAGLVYQKGSWLFDLDFFYNRTNNINTLAPQLGIITDLYGFAKGNSSTLGMDLLLKKRWSSRFNTWLSYSLGFARYEFVEFLDRSFAAPNDIRHNLNFVSSYKYKNFQLSMNANYHSGLPFSQAILTTDEEDPDPEPPFLYFITYDSFNSERLNPYLRIDVNVAYRFDFKPVAESQIEISCSLLNALNRTNYVAREYYVDYNERSAEYKLSNIQKALLDRTALLLLRFYW